MKIILWIQNIEWAFWNEIVSCKLFYTANFIQVKLNLNLSEKVECFVILLVLLASVPHQMYGLVFVVNGFQVES